MYAIVTPRIKITDQTVSFRDFGIKTAVISLTHDRLVRDRAVVDNVGVDVVLSSQIAAAGVKNERCKMRSCLWKSAASRARTDGSLAHFALRRNDLVRETDVLLLLGRIAGLRTLDAAYCYRPSSVVCLSQSWPLQKPLNQRSRCRFGCGIGLAQRTVYYMGSRSHMQKNVKASHTRHRALGPELISLYRQTTCR